MAGGGSPAGSGWGGVGWSLFSELSVGLEHKASGRTDGRTDSPSSSTFFPAGSLERERVETSLRMQDLRGAKEGPRPG